MGVHWDDLRLFIGYLIGVIICIIVGLFMYNTMVIPLFLYVLGLGYVLGCVWVII